MAITKQEKSLFREFAQFVKGPRVGASNADKQPLGMLLQSHIAIVHLLAKVQLNSLMFPDMEHEMHLAPNEEKKPREPVCLSLQQILMKSSCLAMHPTPTRWWVGRVPRQWKRL